MCNLNKYPLPFLTHSVDVIRSSHCFEHLSDIVGLMEEIHRILKPGGLLEVTVPHFGHISFWRDPTHIRPFSCNTFDYFVRGLKPAVYTEVEFEYVSLKLVFGNSIRSLLGKLLSSFSVRKWENYFRTSLSAKEMVVVLQALPVTTFASR